MIETPTVLILGAGASNPYGYPLGAGLVQQIVELTRPEAALTRLYSQDYQVGEFHDRLQGSDVGSIDDFLESNDDFAPFGKLCIAAALTVWGPGPDLAVDWAQNWYPVLWQHLYRETAKLSAFGRNCLRVITYNYDTSLERYFERVLTNAYPELRHAVRDEVQGIMRAYLPILHLHGTLDDQDGVVRESRSRTDFITRDFFQRAASGIRIVHEDQRAEQYETALQWLSEASTVHFLGFGYHPTNARRLNLDGLRKRGAKWTTIGGTALGMEDAEIVRAAAAIGVPKHLLIKLGCLPYIRAHASLW